ncbi:MAG: MFS transporter [Candidatus Eremiobacteraeota bacterium]|nr:MFS transporter [Candidatus Eremiobacteraeota bacterium]
MAVLDGSIANVALPTISHELHVDAAASVWVVNAYQLAVAVLLLPLSSLGDVIGYRKVYASGIAIFTLGSLACALSPSLPILILARVLQGVGGAAIMSIAPALNRSIFPASKLGVAVGISALTVASSSAAGPTLGGALLAIAPWPWLFAINVPIGLFDTLFSARALPAGTPSGARYDFASALLSGPALALLVVALDGFARRLPWFAIVALLGCSVAFGYAFVRRQRALEHPMLPLDLFAIPRFSFAAATSLCSFGAQGLAFVVLPFLVQGAYGYSPFASGLLFTPWPLAIAVVAPIAGRLADRLHPPVLSTIGIATFALGLAFFASLPAHASAVAIVACGIVCGLGFGFFQAPNNRELMGSAPRNRSGGASGVLATVRVTGQSLGAATVAIVLGNSVAAGVDPHAAVALLGPAHTALWLAAGCALAGTLVSALRLRPALRGV